MIAGLSGLDLQPELVKRLRQEDCKFKACLGHKSLSSAWATQWNLVSKLKVIKKEKVCVGGSSG